jgi:hypothetical protein
MVNAPHLIARVRAGATFVNGKLVERPGDPPPEARSPPAALEKEVAKAAKKILTHRFSQLLPRAKRAKPRANAGRHQAAPSDARRLSSLVKCPPSDTEPRPAMPGT